MPRLLGRPAPLLLAHRTHLQSLTTAPFEPANLRISNSATSVRMSAASSPQVLQIAAPDDWHLHVREGTGLQSVVPHSAAHFRRAIIMPNLVPPVTTTAKALAYRKDILAAVPAGCPFEPLMTLYLTDDTPPEEVFKAKAAGIPAFKLYPAGATTNSSSGVTDVNKCLPTLQAMAKEGVLLLVHGEVTDPAVDFFDREKEFIARVLKPLLQKVPDLKVVMEHITTRDAAEFVATAGPNVAATVTPQHILFNRNELFKGGIRPHVFCLPVLKREEHRAAVLAAVTSGNPRFFLGTDSAPHAKSRKENACGCAGIYSAPVALALYAQAFEEAGALDKLEGFTSFHGPAFYGLPSNSGSIKLVKEPWTVPESYQFGEEIVVPMFAGQTVNWRVESN